MALTGSVGSPVGGHVPAVSAGGMVEILGVAGAGKSTLANVLCAAPGFEMAEFIHARKPSHLSHVARSLPRVLPILVKGFGRRPRISWPELKLLAYVTRWHLVLGKRPPAPATVLLFDQGPLYALVRLEAEGKPFTTGRAFERWRDTMLRRWASHLSTVIWLDAQDATLWSRINRRPQGHRKKGEQDDAGYRFILDYRRTFEDMLRRLEVLGGPAVHRFDSSTATAEQLAEAIRPLLVSDPPTRGDRAVTVPDGRGRDADGR